MPAMFDPQTWPHYVTEFGYLAVFLLTLLEGPIVSLYAGLLAAQGDFNLLPLYIVVVAGDLGGDLIIYGIGRYGIAHPGWRREFGTPVRRRRLAKLRRKLRAHAGRILLFGKLTQAFGLAILLAAGAARVRVDKFLLYNLLGTLPKSAALIAVGYYFGRYYAAFSGPLQILGSIGFAAALLFTLYLAWQHLSAAPRQSAGEMHRCA